MSPETAARAELSSAYDPAEVETRRYDWWERGGWFEAEPDDPGEPFAISMPPPNVTGSLHMGHALTTAIEDAFIRHARMQGKNAVWLPGTDHAGIATQNVVERELAKEGTSRHDLGREAFLDRVHEFVEESGGTILLQQRRLGASCDWRREAFTLDEPRYQAVREAFCHLYEQGLVYKGERIINWCPRCQTALSDIEVDYADIEGEIARLRYPAADGSEGVVVATTRVETMLGDTGVAVHPDDERYRHLVGTTIELPLIGRQLPVVADEHVDPEFGTGAVKVTPAHDANDFEIGRRHDLGTVNVMTEEAVISDAGGPYAGLGRFEARERVKADLDARGLLESVEAYTHSVGHCSRCDTPVEPRLSDQWFVRVRPLADEAAAAVRDGRTTFVPERNTKGFLEWLENLHDWCISRQLWWGHRIPAWYDRDGNIHVRREDPVDDEVERLGLSQDPDVLDTWFSSQLWPMTTLGWTRPGDSTPELETWYPNAVMETGYDINTFWVSRMLMIGLHMTGEVPFRVVFNHGMVRDGEGKKMSKSFGNVIDPLDFIGKYGADALRFALVRGANPGTDVPLAEEWVEGARRFCNKLWNAARFVLAHLGPVTPRDGLPARAGLAVEDRWILSRLEAVRAEVDAAYAAYDLAKASRALYHFVWDDYCDWYLELAKLRAGGERGEPDAHDPHDAEAAQRVLAVVLDEVLRLLHPLTPFVTEELWQALHAEPAGEALIGAAWPPGEPGRRDPEAEAALGAVQEAVTALRRFRADHGLSPQQQLDVVARVADDRRGALDEGLEGIRALAGVADWTFDDAPPGGPVGEVAVAGGELLVPLADLIDLDEERARIDRELDKARGEVRRAEGKLANDSFVQKAPGEVVQAERDKLAEWRAAIERLEQQRAALS
ncbi:valine--tRNA ligase [Egibacter rhizosphaerae]|uniref:Valine--tRNA ligase n=1 Tax=Egibacter rhizosphaerae TaxID=1670831 RepID=A0A411YBY6_9ACTN|nr:valine--tRNA ligase [Egibacter rhizosphaerae]QBI18667.1 valine--tRNA ligase [Egibacter rhizosphaerae]